MAKKGKDDAPNPNSVANRDIIQRLNFLYQASVYLNTIPTPAQPVASTSSSGQYAAKSVNARKELKKKSTRIFTTSDLARTYIANMKIVGQKTTVKIDPAVKRTICKGCNTTLIPGSTSSVRVKKSTSHGQCMVYRCNGCKTTRRIPAPPTLVPDMPRTLDLSSMEVVNVASLTHDAMSVDPTPEGSKSVEGSQASQNDKTQRKTLSKGTKPRLPPLFAREAGHVVFCGNERLSNVDPGRGNGIYIS